MAGQTSIMIIMPNRLGRARVGQPVHGPERQVVTLRRDLGGVCAGKCEMPPAAIEIVGDNSNNYVDCYGGTRSRDIETHTHKQRLCVYELSPPAAAWWCELSPPTAAYWFYKYLTN